MDSRQFFRGLGIILFYILFLPPTRAQDSSYVKKSDDSTSSVEKRINTLVDNILSSIQDEIQMTIGQPSTHSSHHENQSINLTDTVSTHDEFTIDGNDSTITFYGDTVIGISDTIRGIVVLRGGSLTVNGVLEGDVTVYGGDIIINRGGVITGYATVVHGSILKKDGGTIGGVMYESSETAADEAMHTRSGNRNSVAAHNLHVGDHGKAGSPQFGLNWLTNSVSNFNPFIIRYNRVDGMFFGAGKPETKPWEAKKDFSLYGSLGYGFALHRWRYNLGLDWFAEPHDQLEAGIEYHDLTDTRDSWFMNRNENSAAAFFVHQDFFDYFGRRGFNIHGAIYPLHELRARIDYLADDYESLPWKTDWSLFGGKKHFRPNPPVFDGIMRSIIASIDYSTIDQMSWERSGWDVHGSAEYAGSDLGGIFSFNRYLVDVRRYQPVGYFSKLSTRVRIGTSSGVLPYQKAFEFGGIGTVNAYPYKEFFGNRMVLANIEYLIHGRSLDESDFWPLEILSPFSLILFLDAGWADYVPAHVSYSAGFETLKWNTLKSDVGVGIGSRDGTLRIAWAWRTDQRSSPVLFFRISRPF